jgi:predicted negative regulator of RcsB-dependent stress response
MPDLKREAEKWFLAGLLLAMAAFILWQWWGHWWNE